MEEVKSSQLNKLLDDLYKLGNKWSNKKPSRHLGMREYEAAYEDGIVEGYDSASDELNKLLDNYDYERLDDNAQ